MAIVIIYHKKWTPYIHLATTTEEKPHCPLAPTTRQYAQEYSSSDRYRENKNIKVWCIPRDPGSRYPSKGSFLAAPYERVSGHSNKIEFHCNSSRRILSYAISASESNSTRRENLFRRSLIQIRTQEPSYRIYIQMHTHSQFIPQYHH
jgi:hypothetical protein